MHFRATSRAAAVGGAVLVAFSAGCGASPGVTATSKPQSDPAESVPGVAATVAGRIPPNAQMCAPAPAEPPGGGTPVAATVSDPAAPRIAIGVPDGWDVVAGTGDTALTLSGPEGMSATVTITATDLDPDGAFLRYTAAAGGAMSRSKFSVTAAEFCGYSSQRLSGTLRAASLAIDFADRIAHIWTNTRKYLVAIHLQAPSGAPGFDAAKSMLTKQFTVVIP